MGDWYYPGMLSLSLVLGFWLSLRTKSESLVLVLRFLSLNKSVIWCLVFH